MKDDDIVLLSAYMDRQLSPEETAELEQRFEREPELSRYLDQLGATDAALRTAFDSINADPLPAELEQLLTADTPAADKAVVMPFPATQRSRGDGAATAPASRWSWPVALAASVALAVGVFIGMDMPVSEFGNPMLSQALQPSDKLAQILSASPSGEVVQAGDRQQLSVRPELSFIHNDGSFCRQYRLQDSQQAFVGIACAVDRQWQNVLLAPTAAGALDQPLYQTASGPEASILGQYLERHMQGIALGAAEEQAQFDRLAD